MPDLGAIGKATGVIPSALLLLGAPRWWPPPYYDIDRVIRHDGSQGPVAAATVFLNGRTPALIVNVLVSDFGAAGGGIAIF